MADPTLTDALGPALDAYAELTELAEDVEDEWTYITDLSTAWRERLEDVALEYAADIARQSPQAIRMLKFAFNLADDGLAGQQVFAGEATRLAYMTDEAVEGKEAFLEKRDPDWSRFPHYF